MAIILSNNIAKCDDRVARRPRGGQLGLVEILSWMRAMRHCVSLDIAFMLKFFQYLVYILD